jgi:hypothetical protein|tara:strand:+ start:441 stop:668 length:228 start_codon:yes stop_codon:yes gene_type:complete
MKSNNSYGGWYRGNSWSHIPNYIRHTVQNTDKGVNIKIYTENGVSEFDCEDVTKSKESWTKGYRRWKGEKIGSER